MENIMDPDPEKRLGSFGSGSATLVTTYILMYYVNINKVVDKASSKVVIFTI